MQPRTIGTEAWASIHCDSAIDHWGFLSRFGPPGQFAITAATDLELASRGASGVLGGFGAALGQGLEETFGPGMRPNGTAARDAALMAELIPSFFGAAVPMRAASAATQLSKVPRHIATTVPKASDFQTAAASITGRPGRLNMEQQLSQLWQELGVHPLDVAGEVARNPVIAEAVKSNLIGRTTGARREPSWAAAAGGASRAANGLPARGGRRRDGMG